MTAPISSSPTWPDLTLTQQTGQYQITAATSVLNKMAKVQPKAAQAEINCAAALKNPAYTRP